MPLAKHCGHIRAFNRNGLSEFIPPLRNGHKRKSAGKGDGFSVVNTNGPCSADALASTTCMKLKATASSGLTNSNVQPSASSRYIAFKKPSPKLSRHRNATSSKHRLNSSSRVRPDQTARTKPSNASRIITSLPSNVNSWNVRHRFNGNMYGVY